MSICLWLSTLGPVATAASTEVVKSFLIPPGPAETTLKTFSEQSGRSVMFATGKVKGVVTNNVKGDLAVPEALDRLLAGTSLSAVPEPQTGGFAIRREASVEQAEKNGASRPATGRAAETPETAAPKPGAASADGVEVIELSVFNVSAERDHGYLVSNAITATRVGAAIIDTPLNIQVVSGELIDDLNVRQFGETVNYVSGAITDKIFPDGDFIRIRGQPIGAVFRNGFRRPLSTSTENIERVEVVKGPSTVFFGEGNPGGIVNYITKKPQLKNAASLEYNHGSYNYHKGKVDAQARLGTKAGVRVIGAYEDSDNWIDFTYNKARYAAASLLIRPNRNIELVLEYEVRRQKMNDGFFVLTSNRQFHADYDSPPADIQAATGMNATQLRTRWRTSSANWALDVERARGSRPFTITSIVNDFSPRGRRINAGGPDLFQQRDIDVFGGELRYHAASWLDLRYAFNWLEGRFDEFNMPLAVNGDRTVRLDVVRGSPYEIDSATHQLDFLLKQESMWGINKLLIGAELDHSERINRIRTFNFDTLTPVTDRTGATLTGINIYRFWDPFLHAPVRIGQVSTGLSPNFSTSDAERRSYYVTHQGEFFRGRLHTMAGLRRTEFENLPGNQAGRNAREAIDKIVPMYGFNFRVLSAVILFASYSENFLPTISREANGPGIRPGEDKLLPPEQGAGWDVGLKTDWMDNRLSGTFSVFQLDRENIVINDIVRRESDPRNQDSDPNNNVFFSAPSGLERSQGLEMDLIYSPTRQFQLLVGYSYMWQAEQVSNPSLLPGTYEHRILIGRRLRSAPEHNFRTFGKYTFNEGLLKGTSVGLGVRYTGEHEALSQNAAFDLTNEASTVVDAFVSYRTQIAGQKISLTLSIDNLLDEAYIIGNRHYGDPFKAVLRSRLEW